MEWIGRSLLLWLLCLPRLVYRTHPNCWRDIIERYPCLHVYMSTYIQHPTQVERERSEKHKALLEKEEYRAHIHKLARALKRHQVTQLREVHPPAACRVLESHNRKR